VIDPELLRDLRDTSRKVIEEVAQAWKEANERCPLECVIDGDPEFFVDAHKLIQVLDHVDHLQTTVDALLSQKKKLEKDLRQTRYLSVLWVKILDSYIPPEMRREAMKACAVGIAEGMKQAEIKEYDPSHLGQLEQQPNAE